MGMSRSARITLLLVIDVVFFFVELIVGYAVGSLALVADSFHMLNDVMSLVVALYAIKLTEKSATDSRYSYGWHRAEILAALINGVFLLALCFSIFLEAIERFFNTSEISNPRLVVVVGSLGLLSNIVGLFLFHEHGHSHSHSHPAPPAAVPPLSIPGDVTPTQKDQRSPSHARSESYSSLYGHPVATRASLVQTAQEIAARSPSPSNHRSSTSRSRLSLDHIDSEISTYDLTSESTALLNRSPSSPSPGPSNDEHHGHGHSHSGSMNMQALLLHVFGDALGNLGVIGVGLVIWLSSWKFKYFLDPVISLIITVIIFYSALPLVRSASFILLQGVPPSVSLDEVRDAILEVDGVLSVHELHVWQLSESKIVASVHVLTARSHDFMPIASKIRKALHHHGIHSSTIQPEYPGDFQHGERSKAASDCLIVCPPDRECDPREHACCPPITDA
ncbi:cation efflux protein [Mycena floridula]|nr:cation efflux protein [Mycena floridula]